MPARRTHTRSRPPERASRVRHTKSPSHNTATRPPEYQTTSRNRPSAHHTWPAWQTSATRTLPGRSAPSRSSSGPSDPTCASFEGQIFFLQSTQFHLASNCYKGAQKDNRFSSSKFRDTPLSQLGEQSRPEGEPSIPARTCFARLVARGL